MAERWSVPSPWHHQRPDIHGRLVDLLFITLATPPAEVGGPAKRSPGARHAMKRPACATADGHGCLFMAYPHKRLSVRKAAIHGELLAHCARDTLAMVEIWRVLRSTNQRPRLPSSPTKEQNHAHATRKHTANTVPRHLMQHLDGRHHGIPKGAGRTISWPDSSDSLADVGSANLQEDIVINSPEFPYPEGRQQPIDKHRLVYVQPHQRRTAACRIEDHAHHHSRRGRPVSMRICKTKLPVRSPPFLRGRRKTCRRILNGEYLTR